MDITRLAALMGELGIKGIDPTKLSTVMDLMKELGQDIDVDEKDASFYFPKVTQDIADYYLPRVSESFYLGNTARLRKLSTPNLDKLRDLTTPRRRKW